MDDEQFDDMDEQGDRVDAEPEAGDAELVAQGSSDGNPRKALIVELDLAVLPGVRAYREACADVLKDQAIDVDDVIFSRFCVTATWLRALSALKAGSGASAEPLIEAIHAGAAARLLDPECRPRPGMADLLGAVREASVRVVFVSHLPVDPLQDRLRVLGLDGDATQVLTERPDRTVGHGVETWKRIVAQTQLNHRQCLAMVGGGFSTKSALATGMRVVAFPDDLVAFEDFSGADGVFASGDPDAEPSILDLLRVR